MKIIKRGIFFSLLLVLFILIVNPIKANEEELVNVSITTSIDGENDNVNLANNTYSYGSVFNITSNNPGGKTFGGWIVDGVLDIAKTESTSFVATSDLNAHSIYFDTKVDVYLDYSNKHLQSVYNDDLNEVEAPNKVGYTFNEWTLIENEVEGLNIYKASYTLNHPNVTINEEEYLYNSIVTLEGEEGKVWSLDGKIVSYNKDYKFSALENLSLDLVSFSGEKENLISLRRLFDYREGYYTYLSQFEVHSGEIIEWGLEVDGEKVKNNTLLNETNEYLMSTLNKYNDVRAYMV